MPEEPLTAPPSAIETAAGSTLWTVVARNERVNREWRELINTAASNAARCYDYSAPHQCSEGRGEYSPYAAKSMPELGSTNSLPEIGCFNVPDPIAGKVTVYYAGPHPDPAPLRQDSGQHPPLFSPASASGRRRFGNTGIRLAKARGRSLSFKNRPPANHSGFDIWPQSAPGRPSIPTSPVQPAGLQMRTRPEININVL